FRQAIIDEVHARPVELVPELARVRRLVFAIAADAGAMAAVHARFIAALPGLHGTAAAIETRQYSFSHAGRSASWEFHTEFVTVTWWADSDDTENWPSDIGLELLGGEYLIGATRIDVIGGSAVPRRLLPGFQLSSLCLVDVEDGKAQLVTDFVPDADRFTRFEFAAGGLTALRRSIIVRRLLEVETYRTMALLGLPLAREISPELRETEIELTAVVQTLSAATNTEKVQEALLALHGLSVRSGQLSERSSYRFAACQAYGSILWHRLAGLHERVTPQGSSLTNYVGNRVEPALATCAAIEKRIAVLSDKIERAIGLLNVRIGLDMQIQNKAVLQTIAQTAKSQFRLQRTVEGLSVIAISYYALGILSYALAGPLEELHFNKTLALSVAAPVVVICVWLMARAVRKAHAE
ncbi:MAG TPA: DUF3422 domain-containing protein, partial [Devosia sp.]|nr:DUF3422 domain-containing protein [Devosia sp.]